MSRKITRDKINDNIDYDSDMESEAEQHDYVQTQTFQEETVDFSKWEYACFKYLLTMRDIFVQNYINSFYLSEKDDKIIIDKLYSNQFLKKFIKLVWSKTPCKNYNSYAEPLSEHDYKIYFEYQNTV